MLTESDHGMVRPCSSTAVREASRGAKLKEHAMSQKLNSAIAVIGIDIGKNSFHVIGQIGAVSYCSRNGRWPGRGTACQHAAVPDRHGTLRWRASPLPQSQTAGVWSQCPADAGEVCASIKNDLKRKKSRRGGNICVLPGGEIKCARSTIWVAQRVDFRGASAA
jgi:hypothetical protein